jgi:murein DD-endopeptidase MepM/ murein hydrolase activator NlpD
LLKIINKILIRIKRIWPSKKRADLKGLLKNPLFYFGLISAFLFSVMYASCDNSVNTNNLGNSRSAFLNSFLNKASIANADSLFSSQSDAIALETPDLKIVQNNTLCAVAAPCVISGKVLGDTFGNNQNKKDVSDYTVQVGDTMQSVANSYKISVNTLAWANDIKSTSTLKAGQSLTILPVDGVLHIVKSGDTISAIASRYKAQSEDIISFNGLANQDDIYVGDILIIPGGVMPKNAAPISASASNNQIPLASNYFIFPAQGTITQGLHYYNAVDLANKCGTPVYAAASGVVQRAVFNNSWNLGMGNYVTILHPNGTVTYYGHFEYVGVKPGDKVNVGDRIGLMGETGNATGCHVHFQVTGATNPLAKYPVGTKISY